MPRISIIIPTLNEEHFIEQALLSLADAENTEVLVVDGGSRDATVDLAKKHGARVIEAQACRAVQLNAGARAATGEILLFLHADCRLSPSFAGCVRTTLDSPGVVAGAFRLAIDPSRFLLRLVERGVWYRSRHLQMPYGDQGVFIKRGLFFAHGGFPEQPLMEDFALMQRLRQRGRITVVPLNIYTSARRWEKHGAFRTTALNQLIILSYYFGISPNVLAGWYRRE